MSYEVKERAAPDGVGLETGVEAEALDGLLEAIEGIQTSGNLSPDGSVVIDPVSEYVRTFLSEREIEVMEIVLEGSIEPSSSEGKIWWKITRGLMRHPSVVSKLAELAGVSLEEAGEDLWKGSAACAGDVRFVESGRRPKKEKADLKKVCDGCPVHTECSGYVESNKLFKGFWAGAQRTDKKY